MFSVSCVASPLPLIIAHRGASAERPENTLAAFRQALVRKADGIELDVQVTQDGVPVVFHDTDLFRLTGVRGQMTANTWRTLQKLRVHGRESIPRLIEVLRFTRGRTVVQIELKPGVSVAPVIRAVRSTRTGGQVVLASFAPGLLWEARRLAPGLPRMLISSGRRIPATLVRQLAACGACGLSVDQRAVRDAAWIYYFHRRGYSVWCWTVNDARRARRLAGWGVEALLGDNPGLLKSMV